MPPGTTTLDPQTLDQIRVRVVACAAFLGLLVLTSAAYGLLPWIDGFARATAVSKLRASVLEDQMFELRVRQCAASSAALKQSYAQRMDALERQYGETSAGHDYPLISCPDLQAATP